MVCFNQIVPVVEAIKQEEKHVNANMRNGEKIDNPHDF